MRVAESALESPESALELPRANESRLKRARVAENSLKSPRAYESGFGLNKSESLNTRQLLFSFGLSISKWRRLVAAVTIKNE